MLPLQPGVLQTKKHEYREVVPYDHAVRDDLIIERDLFFAIKMAHGVKSTILPALSNHEGDILSDHDKRCEDHEACKERGCQVNPVFENLLL